jgi:hypothetical protein
MSYKPRWDNGDWNVICDACGRTFKDNELQLRWDGLMVCSGDWEPRQPQDFVHGVADIQAPKWVRAEQSDEFVHFCTLITVNGLADYGTADCAQADYDNTYRPDPYVCTPDSSSAVANLAAADCSRADQPNGYFIPTVLNIYVSNPYP